MDIRFLESLIAVVDSGSIAQAARSQNITAAAISQRIQTLEQQLNSQLLNRSSHKVKPTEACLNLLPRARKMVNDCYALPSDIDNTGLSGLFRIGAISTALTSMIPQAVSKLGQFAAKAKLQIKPGTSAVLYELLQKEQIDAAIIVKPPFPIPKYLTFRSLRSEKLTFISSKPIVGSIIDELQKQAYIRYDPFCWGGRIVEQFISDNNIIKESICELDALETISILVSKGLGVSLVPAWHGFGDTAGDESPLYCQSVDNNIYDRKLVLIYSHPPNRPKIIDKLISIVSE